MRIAKSVVLHLRRAMIRVNEVASIHRTKVAGELMKSNTVDSIA